MYRAGRMTWDDHFKTAWRIPPPIVPHWCRPDGLRLLVMQIRYGINLLRQHDIWPRHPHHITQAYNHRVNQQKTVTGQVLFPAAAAFRYMRLRRISDGRITGDASTLNPTKRRQATSGLLEHASDARNIPWSRVFSILWNEGVRLKISEVNAYMLANKVEVLVSSTSLTASFSREPQQWASYRVQSTNWLQFRCRSNYSNPCAKGTNSVREEWTMSVFFSFSNTNMRSNTAAKSRH